MGELDTSRDYYSGLDAWKDDEDCLVRVDESPRVIRLHTKWCTLCEHRHAVGSCDNLKLYGGIIECGKSRG